MYQAYKIVLRNSQTLPGLVLASLEGFFNLFNCNHCYDQVAITCFVLIFAQLCTIVCCNTIVLIFVTNRNELSLT